ncbi:hypothetical protein [Mycoplasmopsis pullorum]|uniref:Uncharacterized protein n=1 Tax=Mycoplasmopsis pullorum TaxID=48003 RepID=A0A1L4FRQ5_9BACT|nr:hypothetical protein [Mycoplasmopsis pullorum]APJ38290.1 hypothetical protein BLA55_01190 [Mycoplasmopsis pullorum]
MKRTNKIAILTSASSIALIGAAAIVLPILSSKKGMKITSDKTKNNFINYQISDLDSKKSILEVQDEADINLYFSTYGIMTFFNLVRLAMLSKSETHFLYTSKLLFQKSLNRDEFVTFLREKRELPKDETEAQKVQKNYKKSSVEDLDSLSDAEALEYFKRIIGTNPDKKINLFVNSDHFKDEIGYANLTTEYPNVTVIAIEDSLGTGNWVSNQYVPAVYNLYLDPENGNLLKNAPKYVDRLSQYLITNMYPKIISYFSDYDAVQSLKNKKIKNVKTFFEPEEGEKYSSKEIKDILFNARDRDSKRLSVTWWSKIIGLSWEKERDIVYVDTKINGKPSIIIIGTSYDSDLERIVYIASKYADEYNIYYKGHPGHNYNATWINQNLSPESIGNSLDFVNPITNEKETYVVQKGHIIRALETQIASEELTTYHVLDENPLRFNKWVLFTFLSGAINGINNGYNLPDDVLEIFIDGEKEPINKDNSLYSETIKELITNYVANKTVSLELKEESKNKDVNELNSNDFIATKNQGAKFYFDNIEILKVVSKELNQSEDATKITILLQATSNLPNNPENKTYTFEKSIEIPLNQ